MNTTPSASPVALITGGAGGIGSGITRRLAREGITVIVAYYKSADAAQQLVKEIEGTGHRASAIQADVSKVDEVAKLFASTLAKYGRIDHVINNAGAMVPRTLSDITDEVYDLVFNVNVLKESAKHLASGGRIVNTSSTMVGAPIPGGALYAASKAALELLGIVAAKELGPRGITVNSLRVGATVPGMFSKAPPERQAAMAAASPFKRLGTPADVADVVAFLVSDAGRWITGQTITVDGGST